MRLQVERENYREWARHYPFAAGEWVNLGKATLRNAVCLVLLERLGRPCSYRELLDSLIERRVLRNLELVADTVMPSLRLAVSDLARILESSNSPYRLKSDRVGKEVRLSFTRSSNQYRPFGDKCRILAGEIPAALQPEEMSRALLRDGGSLVPASLYTSYRSAAQWLSYSSPLSQTKKDYEAEAFFAYGFDQTEADTLGIISLAPGEGLGEVELLRRLLTLDRVKTIHYLAIDVSELLLTSHVSLLRERFSDAIASGRLVVAPVHGDLFCLESQLAHARERWGSRFLSECPIVLTYFGNCLGNHEGGESTFFRRTADIFPKSVSLGFLVGVSTLRWRDESTRVEPLTDIYYLDSFTLGTPRALLYEKRLLVSLDSEGNEIPLEANDEFLVPFHQGNFLGSPIEPDPYATPHGVRGLVYRFRYTLKYDLYTQDRRLHARRGTHLVLSSIIKYDLGSLTEVLSERGLQIHAPPRQHYTLRQVNGPEEYRYTVFGVTRWRDRQEP